MQPALLLIFEVPITTPLRQAARRILSRQQKEAIKRWLLRRRAGRVSSDLVALATLFGTDKWGSHWYAQHYQRHFERRRLEPLTLIEIGVGGYDQSDEGGESLRAWKHFFPNSRIVGLDLYDKSGLQEDRLQTFQGSQDDPDFLRRVVDQVGPPDIIIDDGSHMNQHVITSFEILFPLLRAGGTYVVEDTQTSYWPSFGGEVYQRDSGGTMMGFLKSLTDGLNHAEFLMPEYSPSYIDRHVIGMHFYHNLVFLDKGINDEASNMVRNGVLP